MAERLFLDTNILVYSFDRSDPEKQRRAQAVMEKAVETGNGVISYQVVQEFLNVALRHFRIAMLPAEVRTYLNRILMPMCEGYPDGRLYLEALAIVEETGWGFYDSLIVASAAATRCASLLTEDLQDGRVVLGVSIRNPFREPRRR
jgi:predicted nucleic acid-binding protein